MALDQFRIQDAITNDIAAIAEIEKLCQPDPWAKDVFVDEFNGFGAFHLVAFSENRMAGFICSRIVFDEIHIHNLAVHPSFRRQGIARKLLGTTLLAAEKKGVTNAFLEVRESNASAIKLYLSEGFVTDYVRKKYYSDEENALVLCKKLQGDRYY